MPPTGWRPPTAWSAMMALSLAALITACGSSGRQSSAGSCAAVSPSSYSARARVIFVGTMLAGQTTDLGGRRVLVSPARVRVIRYLKGIGPRVVSVVTGVSAGNAVTEDGIQPQAGQRWTIYTLTKRMPYQTSICVGTKPAGKTP